MPAALANPFALWFLLSAVLAALAYKGLRKELRWKAILYGSFLIACAVAIWPPYDRGEEKGKIRLGLDLKGGLHLVLQVMTDEALNVMVDDAVQDAREQASGKGIAFASAQRMDNRSFSMDGVEPARVKDVRDILRDHFRTPEWEIGEPSEGRFVVRMTDGYVRQLKDRTVQEAIKTLERRVNQLGVAEPVIAQQGAAGDQILVQLPGVTDSEQAKRIIKTTAQLHLKIVEDIASSRETLLARHQGKVPDNMEVVTGQGDEPGDTVYYLVRREALITGRDLKNARGGVDENNRPNVEFTLNAQSADKFRRETGRNVGRNLAIILDNSVYSAPEIRSAIGANGQIEGSFTTAQTDELSKILRAGALPASMKFLQELTVGASLGKDSIRQGILAAAAAMAFITIFMLVYYRLSGLNAVVALAANLLILLAAMAYTGAALSLPGIAGVILTVGVGVDTNVLVFERIREELRNG
ncbi:MAG TPA: protein translocase subunit SecD, partial [Vicinamibacteria bacterium]|nr:protein translocase subunit SecD [Vicinamibacteria bacterium]